MKRPIVLFASLLGLAQAATSGTAHADREIGLGVSYDPRVPVGSLRDLVPAVAVAGVQGKWEYYAIADTLALGFDVQYHYFQEGTQTRTVPFENGAATATFTRYAYLFSLIPTVRWFPGGSTLRTFRPFLELGAGVTSATGAVLASDLSRRSNLGGFVAQPSIGVVWALMSRDSLHSASTVKPAEDEPWTAWIPSRRREAMLGISASLAWAFTTADVLTAKDINYVGVQLGVYTKL